MKLNIYHSQLLNIIIQKFSSPVLLILFQIGHSGAFLAYQLWYIGIPGLWKSNGGRSDGKPKVGQYGTVHALQRDQYETVRALQEGQCGSVHALQEGQYRIFAFSCTPNFIHNFTFTFTSVFTPSFNLNIMEFQWEF